MARLHLSALPAYLIARPARQTEFIITEQILHEVTTKVRSLADIRRAVADFGHEVLSLHDDVSFFIAAICDRPPPGLRAAESDVQLGVGAFLRTHRPPVLH